MDQASETFLYPRFDTLTGDMIIYPQWPPTPTGPGYISLAQLAAFIGSGTMTPPITVTGPATVTLPMGAIGTVLVRNVTGAPLTVILPPTPVLGQTMLFKDAAGNAGTYPITIGGSMAVVMADNGEVAVDDRGNVVTRSTPTIDGNPSYTLMSDYASIGMFWMGDQWGTR